VVTRDTRWPAGTPCWVDVSVDDVPKAIAFYQALFQYMPGTPTGTPAAWSAYFAVDSTDAAVATAVELGGSVVQPIGDSHYGRIGVVTDNQGAVFSLITSPQPQ
jgi:uncharacterized protein